MLVPSPADISWDRDLPRRALFDTDKAHVMMCVMTWALDTQQTKNKATQFQACFIKLSLTGLHTCTNTQTHTYMQPCSMISLRGGDESNPSTIFFTRRRFIHAPWDNDSVVLCGQVGTGKQKAVQLAGGHYGPRAICVNSRDLSLKRRAGPVTDQQFQEEGRPLHRALFWPLVLFSLGSHKTILKAIMFSQLVELSEDLGIFTTTL